MWFTKVDKFWLLFAKCIVSANVNITVGVFSKASRVNIKTNKRAPSKKEVHFCLFVCLKENKKKQSVA